MNVKIPLVVVAGPTASGKTELSIELAKRLDGEIVSADSMQLYKYMDIGTAKPSKEEMCGICHYLIGEIDPGTNFSVAQFTALAHMYIKRISDKGKLPILAGGTGLYIQSVTEDINFVQTDTDFLIRQELESIANEKGIEYLVNMLSEFDPVSAQRIHPNNRKRIIRAIEFYRMTGIPISIHQENTKLASSRYNPVMLAIHWDREVLYDKIDKRVDKMVENGLFGEVKSLMDMGYSKKNTSMQGIGYKEVIDYYKGLATKEETISLIKRNSRRYAKRQLTWFKRDNRIHWLKYSSCIFDEAEEIVRKELVYDL
ncbi:MAG: tRNA (adenosine(37)-N6)-dimethylallyltransferase MiaA [Clostridia bacterium]|nr:tRNA (adenosine(37)-N6)-dimethylallyltransferase MiaA [Clostridia bacterium]